MQEEKELVLRQINTIAQTVHSSAKVMPDAPEHYFIWALLSAISIATPYWIEAVMQITLLSKSVVVALELIIMLIVGFGLTSLLLQNKLDESELICTPELRVLRNIYLASLSFAALITVILVKENAYYFVNGVWLFAVGISMYIENTLSKRFFGNIGVYLILIAFAFLIFCLFSTLAKEQLCAIGDMFGFVFISGLLAFLGIKSYAIKR